MTLTGHEDDPTDATPTVRAAGTAPGQRRLNGVQTSGRQYRNLSDVQFNMDRTNEVLIPMRDGTMLRADVYRATSGPAATRESEDGSVPVVPGMQTTPALVSFSCYPRQIQDLGAPVGFIEAGASDFFVPRGYSHVIVNARGTSGSEGTFGLGDEQERRDIYDTYEWVAAQPWCDGAVGGLGISYFALAQLAGATLKPPHLKAIFPYATLDDMYDAVWHRGVLNSGFFSTWLSAVGIMASISDKLWRGKAFHLARRLLNGPAMHARMEHANGEVVLKVLRKVIRTHYPEEPFGRLWQEAAVEHPTHDAWWDERNLRSMLHTIDIPLYLGCQWDNVPMHLPSSFPVWDELRHNPNVRMVLTDQGGLLWPWESMHVEALAWFDHWLKGKDTAIMDGPPIRYLIPGGDNQWRTTKTWPPPESEHVGYALRADGRLDPDESDPGSRSYLYLATDSGRAPNANPPTLPDRLEWTTEPADQAIDIVGEIELELDATITALDTAWIVLLSDRGPDGEIVNISAGWLRAQLRSVDEDRSRRGRPVVPCREPVTVPVGEPVRYRIPIVPNARRIAPGHRIRLVIASTDEGKDGPTVLGFTHTPVDQSSRNTVHSSSRLLLPLLPGLE